MPAVGVEALAKVPLAVEQSDSDERNVEIGRALEVVTGQHAEAARVHGKGFVNTELGREVGDGAPPKQTRVGRAPRRAAFQILLQPSIRVMDAVREDQLTHPMVDHVEWHLRQ